MGRQPCCDKLRVKKGPWTTEEDKKLINFILTNGHCCWRALPKLAGLRRCGKSCRLRWTNYLRPDLKRGLLSHEEEQLVIDLHAHFGNKWSKIASRLPGRTDNEIKNHWNTHIKKRLVKMGIDPVTHQPLSQEPNNNDDNSMEPKSRSTKNVETNGTTTEDESSSTVTGQNSSMDSEKLRLRGVMKNCLVTYGLMKLLKLRLRGVIVTMKLVEHYIMIVIFPAQEQIFRYGHREESTARIGRFRIIVKTLVYMILG